MQAPEQASNGKNFCIPTNPKHDDGAEIMSAPLSHDLNGTVNLNYNILCPPKGNQRVKHGDASFTKRAPCFSQEGQQSQAKSTSMACSGWGV